MLGEEFNNIKKEITKAPVLADFNTQQQLILTVDASQYEVGEMWIWDIFEPK